MSKHILIADDDEQIRELLRDYIAGLGYEAVTANNGKDALEKFLSDKFDMVISDLMMPDMGGLELIKQIRERDKKVIFLMITGFPTLETAIEAIKQGAYDYITKPFNMEDIRIKIERALHARDLEKSYKKITGLLWGLIVSIPIWLILGILLGLAWRLI